MFKGIFKPKQEVGREPLYSPKTTTVTVEEIHETFYTEVDRLLCEAQTLNGIKTDKADEIEKAVALKNLGFGKSKTVNSVTEEVKRLNTLERENYQKQKLAATINYFSQKYPQYKFITEDSVRKICKKYNLIYGEVGHYIGDVPTKNLEEIQKMSIDPGDACYLRRVTEQSRFMPGERNNVRNSVIPKEEYDRSINGNQMSSVYITIEHLQAPLEIAAPMRDFDTSGMAVVDHRLQNIYVPDPIVLHPVYHNGRKHYLIITAWGDEASDPLVVNEKMN